jgi:hypothetical protein
VRRLSIRHIGVAGAIGLGLTLAASAACAEDFAAGPEWLRAPLARGPLAATFGVDERHGWWGIDGTVPLGLGLPRTRASVVGQPVLGLGMSIVGSARSDARDLRYTALIDRRSSIDGTWLGISTGQHAKLQLGTGLWRAFAPVEVEAGLVSGLVEASIREASHWKVVPDSFRVHDTTTFRVVDRSELSTTAQSVVRWHFGRMELTATGGLTVGARSTLQRWAQASMHLQASRRMRVLAAFGQRPAASLAFEPAAHPQTMLGIQVAPWASRERDAPHAAAPVARQWRAQSLADGRTRVWLRCRDASRVELAADFTDWAPIALTQTEYDWWETSLTIAPGLHQVQVRLDGGAWQVPPGLPRTHREFAGDAGVLVVN